VVCLLDVLIVLSLFRLETIFGCVCEPLQLYQRSRVPPDEKLMRLLFYIFLLWQLALKLKGKFAVGVTCHTLLKFCQFKKKMVKMKSDKVLVTANSVDGFQDCEEDNHLLNWKMQRPYEAVVLSGQI